MPTRDMDLPAGEDGLREPLFCLPHHMLMEIKEENTCKMFSLINNIKPMNLKCIK